MYSFPQQCLIWGPTSWTIPDVLSLSCQVTYFCSHHHVYLDLSFRLVMQCCKGNLPETCFLCWSINCFQKTLGLSWALSIPLKEPGSPAYMSYMARDIAWLLLSLGMKRKYNSDQVNINHDWRCLTFPCRLTYISFSLRN